MIVKYRYIFTFLFCSTGALFGSQVVLIDNDQKRTQALQAEATKLFAEIRQNQFIIAITGRESKKVDLWLKAGADLNRWVTFPGTQFKASPLCLAVGESDNETVRLLIENKADLECGFTNEYGRLASVLYGAVYNKKSYDVIATLLAAGADPNNRCELSSTPLHAACRPSNRSPDVVKLLLRHRANINAQDGATTLTPLWTAAAMPDEVIEGEDGEFQRIVPCYPDYKFIRLLVVAGVDPKLGRDSQGNSFEDLLTINHREAPLLFADDDAKRIRALIETIRICTRTEPWVRETNKFAHDIVSTTPMDPKKHGSLYAQIRDREIGKKPGKKK